MQTWDADQVEKDSKRKSAIITIAINVLMLLAFYFIVVWQEQIPPLPTYVLELNIGFTDTGSGDRNSPNAPYEDTSQNIETSAPAAAAPAATQLMSSSQTTKNELAPPTAASTP